MTFVNPLDLEQIFVGTFSGSWMIFFFVMFIVIAFLAARFRMSGVNTLLMFGLFAIIMAAWAKWMYIAALILISIAAYIIIAKPFKN